MNSVICKDAWMDHDLYTIKSVGSVISSEVDSASRQSAATDNRALKPTPSSGDSQVSSLLFDQRSKSTDSTSSSGGCNSSTDHSTTSNDGQHIMVVRKEMSDRSIKVNNKTTTSSVSSSRGVPELRSFEDSSADESMAGLKLRSPKCWEKATLRSSGAVIPLGMGETAVQQTPKPLQEVEEEAEDVVPVGLKKVLLPAGKLGVVFRGFPPRAIKVSSESPLARESIIGWEAYKLTLSDGSEHHGFNSTELKSKLSCSSKDKGRTLLMNRHEMSYPDGSFSSMNRTPLTSENDSPAAFSSDQDSPSLSDFLRLENVDYLSSIDESSQTSNLSSLDEPFTKEKAQAIFQARVVHPKFVPKFVEDEPDPESLAIVEYTDKPHSWDETWVRSIVGYEEARPTTAIIPAEPRPIAGRSTATLGWRISTKVHLFFRQRSRWEIFFLGLIIVSGTSLAVLIAVVMFT